MVNFAVNDAEYEEYENNLDDDKKKEAEKEKDAKDSKDKDKKEEKTSSLPASFSKHLEERKEKSYTWTNWLWSAVPMWNPKIRKGRKYEVKILETKDRMDIRRKIIMIRRFL